MAISNIPVNSYSYTNKDYMSIITELIEVVKKLTNKWDPSISNESDPGVVLLKLNAIIGDKDNYNIDKNILEAFPQTLTQDVSARNIYDSLAYHMPWYMASETYVTFSWIGTDDNSFDSLGNVTITIPRFTMITDSKSSIIYTTTQDCVLTKDQPANSVPALQGVINTFSVLGDTTITLANLDENNRLYFDDYSIAENGVFVTNDFGMGATANPWYRVDNIETETGLYCYEFGVDSRNNSCYLQFPDNIADIIEQ